MIHRLGVIALLLTLATPAEAAPCRRHAALHRRFHPSGQAVKGRTQLHARGRLTAIVQAVDNFQALYW